jgi:hypothetical protein
MVYYFTSSVVDPSGFIYVGKDKFESMICTQSTNYRASVPRRLRLDAR